MPSAAFSPYLTAGVGLANSGFNHNRNQLAWNAGAGLRLRLTGQFSVRIDARDVIYRRYIVPEGRYDAVLKFGHAPELFGGLSLGLGGR